MLLPKVSAVPSDFENISSFSGIFRGHGPNLYDVKIIGFRRIRIAHGKCCGGHYLAGTDPITSSSLSCLPFGLGVGQEG